MVTRIALSRVVAPKMTHYLYMLYLEKEYSDFIFPLQGSHYKIPIFPSVDSDLSFFKFKRNLQNHSAIKLDVKLHNCLHLSKALFKISILIQNALS